MTIRAFFAILLCKLLRFVSRVLHRGGTAMPGRYALKLCPDLLERLAKQVKTVAITGTNGKTTSARMIEEAFREQGLSYLTNRSGANLIDGITLAHGLRTPPGVLRAEEEAGQAASAPGPRAHPAGY